MNIYGHQSEPIIRRDSCNYKLYLFFLRFYNIPLVFVNSLSLLSQSLIYLNSVQLMSIMDHFGYTTRPLVEFNLSIYTERASFLGWLSHMSERKRLAITLDPAASEPARFKNKRVQASGDMIREESEPEVVPISPPSTSRSSSTAAKSSKSLQALNNQPTKTASRAAERKRGADSEDDYKPSTKKTKVKSKRSSSRSKAGKNPTPVLMERLLMLEVNVLNIFSKGLKKLQTLTLPRKVRGVTEKVTVILLLTVKCQL